MPTSGISREPIREEVRRLLLDRLLSGELPPGARINESRLSEEIGVSRTPLREALLRLEYEGFVDTSQGKGFFVAGLDVDAARELYALAGAMEALALQESPEFARTQMARLEKLEEERLEARRDGRLEEAVELDARWHEVLVEGCSNRELRKMLETIKNRLFRYEFVLAEQFGRREGEQHDQHHRILEAMRAGNRPLALELLKHHWDTGARTRSRWIEEREEPAEDVRWTSLM